MAFFVLCCQFLHQFFKPVFIKFFYPLFCTLFFLYLSIVTSNIAFIMADAFILIHSISFYLRVVYALCLDSNCLNFSLLDEMIDLLSETMFNWKYVAWRSVESPHLILIINCWVWIRRYFLYEAALKSWSRWRRVQGFPLGRGIFFKFGRPLSLFCLMILHGASFSL